MGRHGAADLKQGRSSRVAQLDRNHVDFKGRLHANLAVLERENVQQPNPLALQCSRQLVAHSRPQFVVVRPSVPQSICRSLDLPALDDHFGLRHQGRGLDVVNRERHTKIGLAKMFRNQTLDGDSSTKPKDALGWAAPRLYKYVSLARAFDILKAGEIRMTPPRFLNDPHELSVEINPQSLMRDFYEHMVANGCELDRAADIARRNVTGMVINHVERVVAEREKVGILSLCDEPDGGTASPARMATGSISPAFGARLLGPGHPPMRCWRWGRTRTIAL